MIQKILDITPTACLSIKIFSSVYNNKLCDFVIKNNYLS